MESAQKWPILGKKRHFWPSAAPETPHGWKKWIKGWITVEQMWGTTLVAKLVGKMHPMVWKWPKNGQYWAKNAIFGHKWPQGPLVAAKSGTNGGSQRNTCGGATLDAKLVRKMHPMVWKWPKNGQF